ncbi:MAG: tRNA (adenosine(37)-N6)-threonylcarbamoyltransferase complex dimerization subunit type 1 TsaB [Solirubrobacteraceae bacterium]
MIVLGFDTATSATAVALRLADGTSFELRDDPPAGAHPGHATRLLSLAHELLDRQGVRWQQLDRIAAGTGPGTFTGLRVGLATAHGIAQSLGSELVAVSSLRALARAAEQEDVATPVLAVIDARRREVFAGLYGPGAEQLLEPRPLAPAAIGELIAHAAEHCGGARRHALAAFGDGALRYRTVLEQAGLRIDADSSPLHRVSAASICELGAAAQPAGNPVLPDYRRRPDAELAQAGATP